MLMADADRGEDTTQGGRLQRGVPFVTGDTVKGSPLRPRQGQRDEAGTETVRRLGVRQKNRHKLSPGAVYEGLGNQSATTLALLNHEGVRACNDPRDMGSQN